ncbi:MAG: hypothetical protein JO016_16500 [Actinobacteria bacterium]|nr:hypothetical protein [Actinomycetota bacterium]
MNTPPTTLDHGDPDPGGQGGDGRGRHALPVSGKARGRGRHARPARTRRYLVGAVAVAGAATAVGLLASSSHAAATTHGAARPLTAVQAVSSSVPGAGADAASSS